MIKLEKLKELLLSGTLLSKDTFDIDDVDVLLDKRDIKDFDDEWMRNYNAIKQKEPEISKEVDKLIESIREIAYRVTYDAIQSSDLACYVSDDFGLIAEAIVKKYEDDWLNALVKEYADKRIPHGNLRPLSGELYTFIINS